MEKKYNHVYLTTNLISGNQYVGDHSTNTLNDNYLGSGLYLLRAIKIEGKLNFKKEILEHCSTKQEAFDAQEKWINEYNTLIPNGYNISAKGGYGVNSSFISEETKEKISNTLKNLPPFSEERIQKISNGHKGITTWNKNKKLKPLSIEHKELISKNNIGKHSISDEHKQKIIDSHLGVPLSNEHKQKLIAYQKNKEKTTVCPYCKCDINARKFSRNHIRECKRENS